MYNDKTMLDDAKEIFYEIISDKGTLFSFITFSVIFVGMLFFGSLIKYVFFL